MISIKVLIITEIAQLIPKCTWCFVDLAFTFFSCVLNSLIFTVDNYLFLKKINVSLGLSQLQSSILTILIDLIISYCKMLIILFYYTAISKEIILFVNQASLR